MFIVFFVSIPIFVMLSLKIEGYSIAELKTWLFLFLEEIFSGYALNLNEVLGPIKTLYIYFYTLFHCLF